MKCVNHPNENGLSTCSKCSAWLCESCAYENNGRIYCPSCVSKSGDDSNQETVEPHEPSSHYHTPDRHISGLFSTLFALILPGLNFMYMGLLKRGLFYLVLFFGITALIPITNIGLLGLAIPVVYFTCLFDGLEKRRLINMGVEVPDDISDVTNWVKSHKIFLFLTGFVLIVYPILKNIFHFIIYNVCAGSNTLYDFRYSHGGMSNSSFGKLLLILLIVYFIVRKKRNKTDKPQ